MAEFRMPSLGADMENGVLNEWLVKVGDEVHRGDIVAVVETPKSTVEVECFETGTVEELVVPEGERVPVGTVLARLGAAAAPAAADGAPGAAPADTVVAAAPERIPVGATAGASAAPAPGPRTGSARPMTPVLRHLAHQLGVDPTRLHGTGPDGAVTRHDVEAAAAVSAAVPAAVPAESRTPRSAATTAAAPGRPRVSPLARRLAAESGVDLARVHGTGLGGAVRADDVRRAAAAAGDHADGVGSTAPEAPTARTEPAAPPAGTAPAASSAPAADRAAEMRRSIAALMTVSNREIPHYHLSLTIDLRHVVDLVRERNRDLDMGERLVPSAFLLAAAARAARAVPGLNGHWVDDAFRPADDVHLGLILSLRTGGLLVPVIPHADRLTVAETMAAMRELTRRARSGRLRGSDLAPPSISVSNLGDQGVDSVQGVIYPPQVALVGFGAVAERPWAVDGLIGVRPLVTVTLAGDHRASDGATGSRLLKTIDRLLQAPEEL